MIPRSVRIALLASTAVCAAVVAGPSASAAAAHTNSPYSGTRANVPWQRVGSGWTMATWATKGHAMATMFLLSPTGHRYAITRVPRAVYPFDLSPDGRTVLLAGRGTTIRLDLRSGHRATMNLPDGAVLGFTRDGRSVIEAVDIPHAGYLTSRLERFSLDGRHQVSYPVRVPGAGRLGSGLPVADGRLVTGARRGLVLLRHDGTVLRRLAGGLHGCSIASQWRAGVTLARCNAGALWAVPLSGAHVRRLTDSTSKENPYGYSDAWRYREGRLGLAQNSCGPDSMVRFTANGHGHRIALPSPTGRSGTSFYVGHHGDIVDLIFNPDQGCQAGRYVLYAYNAVAHTSRALLGPTVNGGRVIAAITFGD